MTTLALNNLRGRYRDLERRVIRADRIFAGNIPQLRERREEVLRFASQVDQVRLTLSFAL